MKEITKRDITAFLLGVLFIFLLDIVWNWRAAKDAWVEGFEKGYNSTSIQK